MATDLPEQSSLFSASSVSLPSCMPQDVEFATEQGRNDADDTLEATSALTVKRLVRCIRKSSVWKGKRNTVPHVRRRRKPYGLEEPDNGDKNLSDDTIVEELGQWIRAKIAAQDGERLAAAFTSAPLLPPVTRKSLSELDMSAMMSNAKLRHDINLDADLHFRPNFDGDKGREKLQCAQEYWLALKAELELYNFIFRDNDLPESGRERRTRIIRVCEKRLPTMFETIRDILKNLVPERDQERVEEQFDVPMLMQQIERRVCDLSGLANWLAQLLKSHCAPMRDDWVDKMVEQIELAVQTSQSEYMVEALREVLGILEAMKLVWVIHDVLYEF
jgi:hypothetical protein